MSESEKASRTLPVNDNVVIKFDARPKIIYATSMIFDGAQYVYSSTKEITDKLVKYGFGNLQPQQLVSDGIKAQILEPGKSWVTGKVCWRLVVEFIADEPEITEATTRNISELPLDSIRKAMNF